MTTKSPPQQKLTQLILEWNSKLKEAGFKDIEHFDERSQSYHLKQYDHLYFQSRYSPLVFIKKQAYYLYALRFLDAHLFENPTVKEMWALFTQGFGCRKICVEMSRRGVKYNKDQVNIIIRELRGELNAFIKREAVLLGNDESNNNTSV